jgi:hypothetical protein
MAATRLQTRLSGLYESSRDKLTKNSQVLEEVTRIAGNRGYSHAKRVDLITSRLKGVDLEDGERNYIISMFGTSYEYLKERMREKAQIKDKFVTANRISGLRKEYNSVYNIREEAETFTGVEDTRREEPLARIIYHPAVAARQERERGFFNRARGAVRVAASVAAAAVLVATAAFGMRGDSGTYAQVNADIDRPAAVTAANPGVSREPVEFPDNAIAAAVRKSDSGDDRASMMNWYENQLANSRAEKTKLEGDYKAKLAAAEKDKGILLKELRISGKLNEEVREEVSRGYEQTIGKISGDFNDVKTRLDATTRRQEEIEKGMVPKTEYVKLETTLKGQEQKARGLEQQLSESQQQLAQAQKQQRLYEEKTRTYETQLAGANNKLDEASKQVHELSEANGRLSALTKSQDGVINKYRADEQKRAEEAALARRKEESERREAEQTQRVAAILDYEFPLVKAAINPKTGEITKMPIIESPVYLAGNRSELIGVAKKVAKDYVPAKANKEAFNNAAARNGVDASFASALEDSLDASGMSDFDKAVMLAQDLRQGGGRVMWVVLNNGKPVRVATKEQYQALLKSGQVNSVQFIGSEKAVEALKN